MRTDAQYWEDTAWDIFREWMEAETPQRSEELRDAYVTRTA